MSRPLGAKVHYGSNNNNPQHHHHDCTISKAQCDTTTSTARSSWYDDDDDYDNDGEDDKNDDLSSSTVSTAIVGARLNDITPCWGGWLLQLTTHKRQKRPTVTFSTVVKKPSLIKAIMSTSSTSSDDSEICHDDDGGCDQESSCSDLGPAGIRSSCDTGSDSMTPPCPPIVSFRSDSHVEGEGDDEEELCEQMQLIEALKVEGDRYEQQGLLLDALSIYQRLLELLRATGQSANRIGTVHYRTGMIQYKRHHYNEALCHFDQALFIYQLNYDPDDVCDEDGNYNDTSLDFYRVYVATGHVHLTDQNPYRAIDYFHRALQFVGATKRPAPLSSSLSSSSSLLTTTHRQMYDQYHAQVLHALGTAYRAIGNETEAVQYYTTAETISIQQ